MNINEATIVAIGGNLALGDAPVQAVLEGCLARFPDNGLQIVRRSGWWTSSAWPDPGDPPFLNGVALVRTDLGARQILQVLHGLEAVFGRRRGRANGPRTVDLDLIAHGRVVLHEPGLDLPHPRAADRRFVMGPLAEILPDWRHPALGETAGVLAAKARIGADARPIKD